MNRRWFPQCRVLQRGLEAFALRPELGSSGRGITLIGIVACSGPGARPRTPTGPYARPAHRAWRSLTNPAQDLGDVVPAHPARQLAGVLVTQTDVLMRATTGTASRSAYPALGGVQVVRRQQRL